MKTTIILVTILITLFSLFLLLGKIINNKFIIIIDKLNKATNKLNKKFIEKYQLLTKSINIFKKKKKVKNFDINNFKKYLETDINNNNIDINTLNDLLKDFDQEIINFLINNEKLINDTQYKKLCKKINKVNISIEATKKFYNQNVTTYNKLIAKYPEKIIAKILHYSEKNYLKVSEEPCLKILNKNS